MEECTEVLEEKLIAEVCLKFNASERIVKEYLKMLEITKNIVRKDGKIWTPKAYESLKNSEGKAEEKGGVVI